MTNRLNTPAFIQLLLIALISVTPAFGQGGRAGRGMMGDATHAADMHVASMLARVKEGRPIHQRDPLFVELFKNSAFLANGMPEMMKNHPVPPR